MDSVSIFVTKKSPDIPMKIKQGDYNRPVIQKDNAKDMIWDLIDRDSLTHFVWLATKKRSDFNFEI